MKKIFFFLLILFAQKITAQVLTAAHSHNDYLQSRPFYNAYDLNFCSIEADLFLINDTIYVAHEKRSIKKENTLQKLYIDPLLQILAKDSFLYEEKVEVRLLLDLKENGAALLEKLVSLLEPYQKKLKHIRIVISGDMPPPQLFEVYPNWIWFDGRQNLEYDKTSWKRVDMVSESLGGLLHKINVNDLNETDLTTISAFVNEIHSKGKPVRFWGTANSVKSFENLKKCHVDIIGADDLKLLADYLKNNSF